MMKNFKLIKGSTISQGMILIHLDSQSVYDFFSRYITILIGTKLQTNTIKSYANHTAHFLDFLYELQTLPEELVKNIAPKSIFNIYYDFLAYGLMAECPIASELAMRLKKTKQISNNIINGQIKSALEYFLEALESEGSSGFLNQFKFNRRLTQRHKRAIHQSSWLSQCIRKTESSIAKKSNKVALFPRASRVRKASPTDSADTYEKALPASDTLNFLLSQKAALSKKLTLVSSRAYLIDSLQAASGVRTSEALQVLIQDIDIIKKTVKIVPTDQRPYKGLTEQEAERLVYKGRCTSKTLLIEPFATLFWDALKIYLDYFYKANLSHDFLIQKSNGRPFFASDESTRCKSMKIRLKKHINEHAGQLYSAHSLRHMYGVYTHNHIPIIDEDGNKTGQYGLPLGYVKILMGHAQLSTVEIYARKDISIAEVFITLANNKIKYSNLSLSEILLDFKSKVLQELEEDFVKLGLEIER